MYHDRAAITRLQETPITNYLHSLGIEPERSSNGELVYCSPLTGEKTPSFFVHPQKNRFNCFSSGEKGDVIRLVTLLERLSFKEVLERLASIDREQNPSFSFSGQSISQPKPPQGERPTVTLLDERPLLSPVLMGYVIGRGIPPTLAKRYLCEVHYRNSNRDYYAVGFKTDKGSYVVRSKAFKGWLGASSIKTIVIDGSASIDVYEGFFDFLSALAYYQLDQPISTSIVLNSTTNVNQVLPILKNAKSVNCYFDNDNAGRSALAKLNLLDLPIVDCSSIYYGFNDFNEMICNNSTTK